MFWQDIHQNRMQQFFLNHEDHHPTKGGIHKEQVNNVQCLTTAEK